MIYNTRYIYIIFIIDRVLCTRVHERMNKNSQLTFHAKKGSSDSFVECRKFKFQSSKHNSLLEKDIFLASGSPDFNDDNF